MWFSFATNILTLITGVLLYFTWCKCTSQNTYNQFVILTALSAGVAAFGHLEILPLSVQHGLLVVSRFFNLFAIYSFASNSLEHFSSESKNWKTNANRYILVAAVIWLGYMNLIAPGEKSSFFPVIAYGIVGMVFIGSATYILNLHRDIKNYLIIVFGVLLILISAIIFKVIPEGSGVKPSDISHILIAIALVIMTYGVKQNKQHEFKL